MCISFVNSSDAFNALVEATSAIIAMARIYRPYLSPFEIEKVITSYQEFQALFVKQLLYHLLANKSEGSFEKK
jgi:hypothetical protein